MPPFAIVWGLLELCTVAIISSVLALTLSRPFGHSLRFSGIGLLSIHGLRYTNHKADVAISISTLKFTFHFPRPANPRWGTFTANNYEQKDTGCHFSLRQVEVALWFFPVLFRFSQGPLLDVTLDDFKLRVWTSSNTPSWVQRMRRNLVSAILEGEILRCDNFGTSVGMSSMTATGVLDGQDSSAPPQKPGVEHPETQDDIRVTAHVDGCDIINWQKRIYSLGVITVQLRRSWVDDRGSYVMIAEECKWTKVHSVDRRDVLLNTGFWWQLISAIVYFPTDLVKLYMDPSLSFNLYIPRADITFDDFRIRDAELLRQGFTLMQQRLSEKDLSFIDVISDAIVHTMFGR